MRLRVELALAGVTAAAVFGLIRLFADASFLPEVMAAALVSHALAAITRRAGWGLGLAAVASAAGLAVTVGVLLYPDTTTYGFPSWATRAAAGEDLSDAWRLFQEVDAPAPAEAGFVLACIVAAWMLAFTADWAAFRLSTGIETVLPSGTLFVFASVLGAARHRGVSTGVYLLAVLVFLLLHRVMGQQSPGRWLATDPKQGGRAMLRTGLGLGAAAVVAGLVLGPVVPGANDPALISWRDRGDGPSSRVTVSPLVDIRSRLVDQSGLEAFKVRSDTRSYWRLTALDRFDGRIWSSKGSYRSAQGELPAARTGDLQVQETSQDFSISGLSSIWLPAAFEPRRIRGGEAVRYDPESASLLTEHDTSDGLRYRIVSALPRFRPAQLDRPRGALPDDVDRYLELPDGFSEAVRRQAEAQTAQAGTAYRKALALQGFFREQFTYDLTVGEGHGQDVMEQFLAARRGYCEQFAGTFAAMARSIGMPARVAVGFTPGDQDPADRTVYHVRGEHAHAWPEVYLAGVGWVAFEPTPGRGAPGAESYTRVPEQQATSGAGFTTPTTVAAPVDDTPTGPAAETQRPAREEELQTGEVADGPSGPSPWPRRLAVLGLVLLVGAVAWAAGVPLYRRWHRERRRQAATTPRQRVVLAWTEASEALSLAGAPPHPAETHDEYARRAAAATRVEWATMVQLARLATEADYSPADLPPGAAEAAVVAAAAVDRTVWEQASTVQQLRWALDPRPRLRRPHQRQLVTSKFLRQNAPS